jgi:hypothetical protein
MIIAEVMSFYAEILVNASPFTGPHFRYAGIMP